MSASDFDPWEFWGPVLRPMWPIFLGTFVLMIGGVWFCWLSCGAQAAVWQREGIEITQYEVFMGAHPAEKNINLRDDRGSHDSIDE